MDLHIVNCEEWSIDDGCAKSCPKTDECCALSHILGSMRNQPIMRSGTALYLVVFGKCWSNRVSKVCYSPSPWRTGFDWVFRGKSGVPLTGLTADILHGSNSYCMAMEEQTSHDVSRWLKRWKQPKSLGLIRSDGRWMCAGPLHQLGLSRSISSYGDLGEAGIGGLVDVRCLDLCKNGPSDPCHNRALGSMDGIGSHLGKRLFACTFGNGLHGSVGTSGTPERETSRGIFVGGSLSFCASVRGVDMWMDSWAAFCSNGRQPVCL